jgi:predicted  nucleic acid-binding Zn-ribbon protein
VSSLETLKALVALQEVDVRIRDLEKDRQQIPARMEEIDGWLNARGGELNAEKNQLDEAEMARRMLESDLRAEKEKIKKWESRLNEIKSNRDYQALSREIEAARKANLGIEDEILRKMQDIEDLKISIAQKQEDLSAQDGQLASERAELQAKLESLNADISSEVEIREKALVSVDSRWYRQYDTIRGRRDGVAVVGVLDEHCQGCHMGIPPQLYNIVLRGEQIELCPFCHRILFYKQALVELDTAESQD